MTDEQTFLAAILNDPAEDTHRLVYADWLDEQGGAKRAARAELIRVQCALVREKPFDLGLVARAGPGSTQGSALFFVPSTTIKNLPAGARVCGFEPAHNGSLIHYTGQVLCIGGFDPARDSLATIEVLPIPDEPSVARLREREAALLKKWGRAWLPRSLRPSGPHAAMIVEGETVASSGSSGYVRFDRGFIGHAGCAFTLPSFEQSVGEHFARELAAIFRANPLTGFTVSFDDTPLALTAEIAPREPDSIVFAPHWRIMWDMPSVDRLLRVGISDHPALVGPLTRDQACRDLVPWLVAALRAPAELAVAIAADADPGVTDEPEGAPDLQGPHDGYDLQL